jgi:peptidoglycan/LPS O-acetylase OafA/YrhL
MIGQFADRTSRIGYLDGLRGLAALQVVLYHYGQSFAPPQVATLGFLVDGNCAVLLFFLLSGRVLSPAFARAPAAVWAGLGQRLIRLGLPLLAAAGFALLLQALLPDWAGPAAALSGSGFLGRQHVALEPGQLLAELSGLAMLTGYDLTTLFPGLVPVAPRLLASANLPVWSLHVELFGSALVLGLVWARARARWLHLGLIGLGLALIGGNALVLFILGHLAALLEPTPKFRRWLAQRWVWLVGFALLLAGSFLAEHRDLPGIWLTEQLAMSTSLLQPFEWFAWNKEIAAMLVFAGLMLLPPAQRVLQRRLPAWLGRVSFGLYLLHWPVMMTLGSAVFLLAAPLGRPEAAALATLAGLAVTLPLAAAFTRWVDAPATQLARRLRRPAEAAGPTLPDLQPATG